MILYLVDTNGLVETIYLTKTSAYAFVFSDCEFSSVLIDKKEMEEILLNRFREDFPINKSQAIGR